MSADNYGVVHRHKGRFGLSMGAASNDHGPTLKRPFFTSASLKEVVDYANDYYFEYGWSFESSLQADMIEGLVERP